MTLKPGKRTTLWDMARMDRGTIGKVTRIALGKAIRTKGADK